MVLRRCLLLSCAVAAAAVVACTSTPDGPTDAGASCPQDLPAACPNPPPSYAAEVLGVFQRRCFVCHTDGGVAAGRRDFSTYDKIFAQRSPILNQVYACQMPPPDAGQPTPAERAALLGWLVCKAPNN